MNQTMGGNFCSSSSKSEGKPRLDAFNGQNGGANNARKYLEHLGKVSTKRTDSTGVVSGGSNKYNNSSTKSGNSFNETTFQQKPGPPHIRATQSQSPPGANVAI
jgi:hypothetical protein